MDFIKEAFNQVRQEIISLREELSLIKEENVMYKKYIQDLEISLSESNKNFLILKEEVRINKLNNYFPTEDQIIQTNQQINTTNNTPLKVLKGQNNSLSMRNDGVPTNQQTNKQTNQQTNFILKKSPERDFSTLKIEKVTEILNSLDNIKKEIRLKFKKLTNQEMLVFSTIYQFDEEIGHSTYKILSKKLNLTESSIRDYVGKIIKKGIPVEKIKINNKDIQLNISPNLKRVTSLNTILQLREI